MQALSGLTATARGRRPDNHGAGTCVGAASTSEASRAVLMAQSRASGSSPSAATHSTPDASYTGRLIRVPNCSTATVCPSSRHRTSSSPEALTPATSLPSRLTARRVHSGGTSAKGESRASMSSAVTDVTAVVATGTIRRPSRTIADCSSGARASTNPNWEALVHGGSMSSRSSGEPLMLTATSRTAGSCSRAATSCAERLRRVVGSGESPCLRSTWATPSTTGTASKRS